MSSSYTSRLKLEKMATGANANTWGTRTNNNLDEKLNKIEGLLTEAAIYDPIGFRQWHKEFSSYVEHKFIEEVEKVRNRRK